MPIYYRLGPDGSFTAGDDVRGVTSYAYPSSIYATRAARHTPAERYDVAEEMLRTELRHGMAHEIEYDARNWERIRAPRR